MLKELHSTADHGVAYNPPCAFNPYTTCPLPTEQNRMRVRIEAGELDYHKAASHEPQPLHDEAN